MANFSVERMAPGGACLQIRTLGGRRHRSPRRSASPRYMRKRHIITLNMLVLIAGLASNCSKSQSVPRHVTISADRGTNLTAVTTSGYTFMLGKTTTNTLAGSKASP
jgi:hypothetical protein